MGNNTSKTEKAAGCGCLIGLLLGVVYAVMTMFSGMRGNPVIFLIIIPIFGIFGASIPMSIFSPDKSITTRKRLYLLSCTHHYWNHSIL